LSASGELPPAGAAGAAALVRLLAELEEERGQSPDRLLERVLEETRYLEFLEESSPEDARERRDNVEELVHGARLFAAQHPESGVEEFLSEAALVADVDRWTESEDRVVLLTAHNAKGLEFPVVMVAGCEEGVFPHSSALADEKELEEERRLFYVALTRARDEVMLSAAAFRRRYDGGGAGELSRFVREIPPHLLVSEDPPGLGRAGRSPDDERVEAAARSRRHEAVGRTVYHADFGAGTVLDVEGAGGNLKFTVRFGPRVGIKKVLGRFLHPDD